MTTPEFIIYGLLIAACSFVAAVYLCDILARWIDRRRERANCRAAYELLQSQRTGGTR